MAGDLAQGYRTVPILYGAKVAKGFIALLILLTLVPTYLLIWVIDVGYMIVYFLGAGVLLLFFLILLLKSNTKRHYVWLHNILKFIIIAGVFGILLIDVDLVINRIL